MRSIFRLTAATALACTALVAMGCASTDRHVFHAQPTQAATVAAVDTITEQALWNQEIPPGHRLLVDLDRTRTGDNVIWAQGVPADRLKWSLFAPKQALVAKGYLTGTPLSSGTAEFDGRPIHLVYTLHPAPPLPAEPVIIPQDAAETPAQPAAVDEQIETVPSLEPADPPASPAADDDDAGDAAPASVTAPDRPADVQAAPAPAANDADDADAAPAGESEAPVLVK